MLDIARARGAVPTVAHATAWRAFANLRRGAVAVAADDARTALGLLTEYGIELGRDNARALLANALLDCGDLDAAERTFGDLNAPVVLGVTRSFVLRVARSQQANPEPPREARGREICASPRSRRAHECVAHDHAGPRHAHHGPRVGRLRALRPHDHAALHDTGDRTFVGAFQAIDEAIINPVFLASFLGALAFTGLAAWQHRREGTRSEPPWLVAALALYLAAFVITIGVNVPLNDEIKAAGNPDRIADLAAVREDFDEATWVLWNAIRTVASSVAFACLAWTLVLHGRAQHERRIP
jgi:uncharacterized membrane protein